MNRLKQIGVQQYRLKAEFSANSESDSGTSSAEPEALTRAPISIDDAPNELVAEAPRSAPSPNQSPQDQTAAIDWQGLQRMISDATICPTCNQSNSLLGDGNAHADWMFVVDAPTQAELSAAQFFTGRAGKLFSAMLVALGVERESVYCSSVFKCAATEDLSTSPQCDSLLLQQIQLVQPKVVVTFGEFVAQKVIRANEPLAYLREAVRHCYQSNVPIVATYSPSEMLEQPALKAMVWQDLKRALALLEPS